MIDQLALSLVDHFASRAKLTARPKLFNHARIASLVAKAPGGQQQYAAYPSPGV